jgi:hypothetical protein
MNMVRFAIIDVMIFAMFGFFSGLRIRAIRRHARRISLVSQNGVRLREMHSSNCL